MSEYETRLSMLQKKTADAELDAFLISTKDSIYYFTGRRAHV